VSAAPLVRIRPYAEGDLALLRGLLGDTEMTRFLGGPESENALAARHARYLAADPETNGLFTVLLGEPAVPVGWVGFWETEWEGAFVWECGWHVLPEFQGQGVATGAMRLAVDDASSRRRHRFMDAFPSADNVASNAVCRRLGFRPLGEVEVEYPKGCMMRAQHWRLELPQEACE